MFSQDSRIQLAVLEERFKSHEQIIEKVDAAIQTLSETNQNICKMLAVHDERLDQCNKDDNELTLKVERIEKKVEDISKIKWMVVGIGTLAAIVVAALSQLAGGILIPSGDFSHQQIQQTRLTNK